MRSIRIDNVSKSLDGEVIIDNLSLEVPSGKFFVLLGPSGCGKTTLLRLIGGLETVDSGRIFLGDQEITKTPIYKRSINTVFQQYALFPHLNVFENVAYGLRIKKVKEDEIKDFLLGKFFCSFFRKKPLTYRLLFNNFRINSFTVIFNRDNYIVAVLFSR